jgi:hypothetical protein
MVEASRYLPRKIVDTKTNKRLTEDRKRKIVLYYLLRGCSFQWIGSIFDVSDSRMYRYCKQNKMLPARRLNKQITTEEIELERKKWGIRVDKPEPRL